MQKILGAVMKILGTMESQHQRFAHTCDWDLIQWPPVHKFNMLQLS
jgi:hypothetical protein